MTVPGIFSAQYRLITLAVLVASLLLSAWGVWVDNVINNDGVEYVRAARMIQAGDWAGAIKTFKWPAYPALLAMTSSLTGISPEYAAHVVNALFTGVLLLAFLACVLELGADRRTFIAAAIIILLAPRINDWRPFVIRDPGYLAFYTLSMLYLFRFVRNGGTGHALRSFVMMLFAIAFRMEGIAFLVLMPLVMAIGKARSSHRRGLLVVAGAVAMLVLGAGFMLWFVSLGGGQSGVREFESLRMLIATSWDQLSSTVADKLYLIEKDLLGQYSKDYAVGVLALTLVMIVFTEVVKSVSLWTGLLIIWSLHKRILFPVPGMLRPWLWIVAVNLLVLGIFTLIKLFLTERYSLALTVTLLLAAPFGLLALYESWRRHSAENWRIRYAYPTLVFLILVAGIESLGLFTEKRHIKQAGQWVASQPGTERSLYTNSKILAHYAEVGKADVQTEWHKVIAMARAGLWKHYDYVAIRVGRNKPFRARRLIEAIGLKPAQRFLNHRDDLILVFAIPGTG